MLRLLLFLSAVIAADAQVSYSGDITLDFNTSFYGQQYDKLYVNTTGDNFTICFNGYYGSQEGLDCIITKSLTESPPAYALSGYDKNIESFILKNVPSLTTSMIGRVIFNAPGSGDTIYIYDFGKEALLQVRTDNQFTVLVMVNGTMMHRLVTDGIKSTYLHDISGCRQSGVVYKTGDLMSYNPHTCKAVTCNETDVYDTLITCREHTCTVSGPAVIDSSGRVNSVQDRCAHSLVLLPSFPSLHVLANFQERRRKDVSFLDSVTLRLGLPRVDIHLQQGGRVQLNDTTLTLNSSVLEVHGVELSKDQTGVTAKVSLDDLHTSVFFDGNTAHISLTRMSGIESLQGLCGNSSSEVRLSQDSTRGCEVLHNDSAGPAINCSAMTKRCNLLNEAPFTACHNHTDPAPYIAACTDILCKYPAVDGLTCQFLEAYAKTCSNITLEDWRSTASCSAPRASCQDRLCSAHEFCAVKASGEDGCFCRALFATRYRSTGTLGDPTVCERDSASLSLVGCLLEEKGIDYSTLHLNDNSCVGQMDEQTHMVTFSFSGSNSCGTVVSVNNSQVIYKNTIMTHNHTDVIVRHDQVAIDFSCFYAQPDIKTMAFRIKDSSVIEQIISGAWNYTLTMKAYLDPSRTRLVESSTEVMLNQKIWVQLETNGLGDGLVAVVTDSCWATDQASSNASRRHDLIIKGCASSADQTVHVEGNGQGTSNYFSFNMFQFTGSSTDVYLHCRLNLCVKQNNSCAPNCSGGTRRRRSARSKYVDEAPAFITMAWTN